MNLFLPEGEEELLCNFLKQMCFGKNQVFIIYKMLGLYLVTLQKNSSGAGVGREA